MNSLSDYLNASQSRHSHLCPRQILGVRVALAGLKLLNIDLFLHSRKKLLVIAETDGCFVDGIEVTAQVSVGHRTLKIEDYGKIAATFIDIKTTQAVRIHPVVNIRELALNYFPLEKRPYFTQLKAYQIIPDCELLNIECVTLNQDLHLIIGSPSQRTRCEKCGEEIINGREVTEEGTTLCKACAGRAYYQLDEFIELVKSNPDKINIPID
jgi:formylmethanofuran dehydrogenase subunit E